MKEYIKPSLKVLHLQAGNILVNSPQYNDEYTSNPSLTRRMYLEDENKNEDDGKYFDVR